ncbi:junctophilin-1 isoform X2 [Sitodiplosis mosellana]|uniref:junctophilin-1 isoform X2 n=1 Tax=Sitodiplosis mosellana TaxID=263140 RepID=UPI002444B018|nr:junctophilin-1 isoform X2 [Sitodiplosis mosellana]XP_055299391.1 junctophilin-1 isoform X2 [Sitodiplosis mosellana]XP_055299393.1 junctophilin-1 isoform X2 [Sitodiplosis mosellana]XP_055299394.1 junctophilin-1 isoform X2 [Sitodiplosis mosellana]
MQQPPYSTQQVNFNYSAQNNEPPAIAPNSPGSATTTTATTPTAAANANSSTGRAQINGGRFDFEDGGTYCGGWDEGKAHGHGVCTGPKHQGAYSGAWNYGFEVSGVYIWPSGSSFEGQWQNGRRHGLGVETRGRWIYRGEWTSGSKGRYGVRQSATSTAKYEGTWASGLQDGYGSETYADGGTYQGQWQEGKRHGYGVRTSAPFGLASHYRPKNIQTSMTSLRSNEGGSGSVDAAEKRNHRMDEIRGGFVLKAKSDESPARRNSLVDKTRKGLLSGLKLKKMRSTGDLEKRGNASGSIRSTISTASWISTGSSQSAISNKSVQTDSNASFTVDEEHLDPSVTEVYMGEWKRDKRDGYGISERSDGLKYEGEWHNNKKHGYGVTTFRDGSKEEGKYKYNVLITSQKKKHLFLMRSAKFRERIDAAVSSSQRASKYALQKADIAVSRTATARSKAEMADSVGDHARVDSEIAVATAREFAPDFKPSVLDRFERLRVRDRYRSPNDPPMPSVTAHIKPHLMTQASSNTTPNHLPTQASIDSTPQKQPSFPNQASLRRQSMLQKQASIDVPPGANIGPLPQHTLHYTPPIGTQPPFKTYQPDMYNSYGNQEPSNLSNYNTPNQNVFTQSNTQQFNNSSYTGNVPQMQSKYPANNMMQSPYGGAGESQMQYGQQYNTQQQSSYQNYSLGSQQVDGAQDYQSGAVSQYANQQYSNQNQYDQTDNTPDLGPGPSNLRRNSRNVNESTRPHIGSSFSQSSIDHFDHYKRPPSRDSSVDRYARAASRLGGSRQPSIDRSILPPTNNLNPSQNQATADTVDRNTRAGSAFRNIGSVAMTPAVPNQSSVNPAGNGSVMTGIGKPSPRASLTSSSVQPTYSTPNQPFEDVLLRQRNLGQDIIPSPREPKRTESLYTPQKPGVAAASAGGGGGGFFGKSGKLKDWFSRQQLVLLVLVVNIALAIMFFRMLT